MLPEEYRKMADVEDRMWYYRAVHRRVAHWLKRMLPAGGGARVLDAGCGTGGLIKFLRSRFSEWNMTGLDFSPVACELARPRTQAEIVEGSIAVLPFDDASFDAAVSVDVLCQIDDPAAGMRELARVVRPDGVVLVNVPAFAWLWSYHDEAVQSKQRFTRPQLRALCADAGLLVEFASYANLPIFPLVVARRKWMASPRDGSDVHLQAAPIEAAFSGLAALEAGWMRMGFASPVGSSVFVVARRKIA